MCYLHLSSKNIFTLCEGNPNKNLKHVHLPNRKPFKMGCWVLHMQQILLCFNKHLQIELIKNRGA